MSFFKDFILRFVNVDEELSSSIEENKILNKEIKGLQEDNDKLGSTLKGYMSALAEQLKQIALLKAQISLLDSTKYESYLSSLYKKKSLIYTKRWAVKDSTKTPMNVCDFIFPRLTLKDGSSIEKIWQEKINYVKDDYAYHGIPDFWQTPEETNVLRAGDCEDSSDYRISKAKANGIGNNLFRGLGFYNGEGHAFPLRMDENFELWVLESTTNSYNPIKLKGSEYHLCYISNEKYTWEVDGSFNFGKLVEEFGLKKERGQKWRRNVTKKAL